MRSIRLITGLITDSIVEGKKQFDKSEVDKKAKDKETQEEPEEVQELAEKSEELVEGIKVEPAKDKEDKRTRPPKKRTYKRKVI